MIVNTILSVVIAYLLGSIPTAYLITRWKRAVDIREVGYRYSGAKNVFQEVGPGPGVVTAFVDIAKGALAILQMRILPVPDAAIPLVGVAVVAGHIWPVYLQFRGGAGFATALGVTFAAVPIESLLLLVPYLVLLLTVGRRFGLGVRTAPLIVPLVLLEWRLGEPSALVALPLALGVLVGVRVYSREVGQALRRMLGRAGE